jgi:DNA invertase Pin-like site-specific DNA recombinase
MARKKKVDYSSVAHLVYVYLRVSTEKQKKDGKGLEAQLADCIKICQHYGLTILKIVQDPGLSGKLPPPERPGLQEAMEGCADGLAAGIVSYDQARYARSMAVDEVVRMHAIEHGYKLYAGFEEITAEENEMSADIRAMFASMERKMIVRRLKNGRIQRAEVDGRGTAPLPYGYTLETIIKDGEAFEIISLDPIKTRVVSTVLRMEAAGSSLRKIAAYLNENGYRPPYYGKTRQKGKKAGIPFKGEWTFGQVQKIVGHRDLYCTGIKTWNGIEGEQKWPILFEEQLTA